MTRILIFTGKGGVGKTSVAAAHARSSAKEGKKTLLVSTDMAHNLSDLFEMPVGRTVKEVAPKLFALELDPGYMMEHDFKELTHAVTSLLYSSAKVDTGSMGELLTLPGMEELFSLLKILDLYEEGTYERILVDCAPTGETLSLLKFPELLSWYMEKFFPVGRLAVRVLSPIAKAAFKVELPNREAMNDIERIYIKLVRLQELLKDRETTSVRLVAIPEKMVVEETKRNYMYMNLYNFCVDGIYINRILPEDIGNPFFKEWISIQEACIRELSEVFADLLVCRIPWYDSDLNGLAGIDRIERDVLSGKAVFQVRREGQGERYEKTEKGYRLRLSLPCVQKGEIKLHESETDLILKIGNFKRNIPKPNTLRTYEIAAAKMEQQELLVSFVKKKGEMENEP